MGWQYHVVELEPQPDNQVEAYLNVLGEQDWELVTVYERRSGNIRFLFKRPLDGS